MTKPPRPRLSRGSPCRRCGADEWWPLKNTFECAPCSRAACARYRDRHRALLTERNSQRYLENKAFLLQRRKIWVAQNRVRHNQIQAEWREKNPDRTREIKKKSRLAHPNKDVVWRQNRRARILSAPGRGVRLAEWDAVFAGALGLCAYCNERRPLSQDHIEPLSAGGAHDIDNIAGVCESCNFSKQDTALIVWLARRAQKKDAALKRVAA